MGCQCSRSLQDRTRTNKFKESNVGLLDVHLTNGKLYEKSLYNHGGKQAQIFFRIQVSNQEYISRLCSNFSSEGFFNSYFSFFINSDYRADGRILQVQLFLKLQKSGNQSLGKGSVDISKVIDNIQSEKEIKCIMMNKNDPLGYVNCVLSFNKLEFKKVSFRFQSFILRKYRHMVHSLKVQVLLGQESLFTSVCEDKPCKPSSWTGDILSFKVPNLLKFGIIRLYDNGKSFGQTVIKIQQLLHANQNEQFVCFSQLYDNENNQIGSIKYSMILGNEPKFTNEQNLSVKYTNLQINVNKSYRLPHMITSRTGTNSGVEIVFKKKDTPSRFLQNVDNEIFERNFGSAQHMKGSMTHFSVFSIEDLSKFDKQSEK